MTTSDDQLLGARRATDAERFATTLAHELGSSLLVVSRLAELLQSDPDLCSEQADRVERIVRMTGRMRRMAASAHYLFSDFDELEIEDVWLSQVVEEALETLAPLIEERHAQIAVNGPLPVVAGVHIHLVQLFENLLSNAIKYGPDRGGRVELTVTRDGAGWRVAVSDQGPGIPLEYRESIFDPFRRLRGTGHLPGTGLGLTICRQIAENHGGTLTVESGPAGGATLVLGLPDRAAVLADRVDTAYALRR